MNNQKGFANLVFVLVIFVLAGVSGYFALNNRLKTPRLSPLIDKRPISPIQTPPVSLLRFCPEEWVDNRMPSTFGSNDLPKEYFIYKGVRRELSEFDVNWVKTNCTVKSVPVY